MNNFQDRVVYLGNEGETLVQDKLSWSCGCVMKVIPPKQDVMPGVTMGFSYLHDPCEKHVKTFQ